MKILALVAAMVAGLAFDAQADFIIQPSSVAATPFQFARIEGFKVTGSFAAEPPAILYVDPELVLIAESYSQEAVLTAADAGPETESAATEAPANPRRQIPLPSSLLLLGISLLGLGTTRRLLG